nr:SHOCT domain-containing protein [Actinomycetota bacterium]
MGPAPGGTALPSVGVLEAPFFGLLWLGQIAFWILVVIVIAKLVQNHNDGSRSSGTALGLLEERYARGEITREEFIERRTVLRGETGSQHTA